MLKKKAKKFKGLFKKVLILFLTFIFAVSTPVALLAAEATLSDTADNVTASDSAPFVASVIDSTTFTPVNDAPAAQTPATPDPDVSAINTLGMLTSEGPSLSYGDERKPVGAEQNINTDSVNGSLNFDFPINIPPGRNGLQPDLKLTYNNQAENNTNLFGFGWSTNIPYIERINKRGMVYPWVFLFIN